MFDKNSKYMLKIIGEGSDKTELLKIIKNNNLRVEIESNVDNELLLKEMNNMYFIFPHQLLKVIQKLS